MTNNPFWGEEDPDVNDIPDIGEEGWYHIRARCIDIFKPKGKVIQFWLYGKSKDDIEHKVLDPKSNNRYKDIEWIKKETPPFV